jgi:hypothetical protein
MTSTSLVIWVALLVLVQGCILAVDRGGRPPELGRQRVRSNSVARRATRGYGPKAVQDKQPPARLLARDGTSCVVSEQKYESTALGASVWCIWVDTNR